VDNLIGMNDSITASTRDLLEWLSSKTRTYDETMEAWRTSCPKFSVWEDSEIDGLIRTKKDETTGKSIVVLTEKGQSSLNGAV
jgi:hypothetical protein